MPTLAVVGSTVPFPLFGVTTAKVVAAEEEIVVGKVTTGAGTTGAITADEDNVTVGLVSPVLLVVRDKLTGALVIRGLGAAIVVVDAVVDAGVERALGWARAKPAVLLAVVAITLPSPLVAEEETKVVADVVAGSPDKLRLEFLLTLGVPDPLVPLLVLLLLL